MSKNSVFHGSQRSHRIYNIEEICAIPDEEDIWLVHNMIPKVGRTIVYGHGGTFKSTVIFDLCVAVASKGSLLRQFPIDRHGPVLLVSTESSKYTNKKRILSHIRARESQSPELTKRKGKAPVPSLKEIPLYFCHSAFELEDYQDSSDFYQAVKEIKPVLIVLDPLDSFISGDENSAKETKPFRRYINKIIEEFETSVIVIHHSTKGENQTIRGSGAWRGWTDAALFFQKKTTTIDGQSVNYVDIVADKQRDGIEGKIFSVLPEFNQLQGMTTFSILGDDRIDPDSIMLSQVQEKILRLLMSRGPLTKKDIQLEVEYSRRKVDLAFEMLLSDGYIANDVFVFRSSSEDGQRQRRVPAWRTLPKTTLVDIASALIKGRTEEPNSNYFVQKGFGSDPFEEDSYYVPEYAESHSIRHATVPSG